MLQTLLRFVMYILITLISTTTASTSTSWLGSNRNLFMGGKSNIKRSIPSFSSRQSGKNKRAGANRRKADKFTFGRRIQKHRTPTLVDRIEAITKQGESAYKSLYRAAKVIKSSPFEALLLKATWPNDDPVPKPILRELIKRSIPAFKSSKFPEDDPYHVTTHKLWMKMCEGDWRTVVKALVIMHTISREASPKSCKLFGEAVTDMSKQRVPKFPRYRYFDTALISTLDKGEGDSYKEFVVNYATYTLFRLRYFSSSLVELTDDLDLADPASATVLKRAKQLLAMGLKCVPSSSKKSKKMHAIFGSAVRLLDADMRVMAHRLQHYTKKSAALPSVNVTETTDSLKALQGLQAELDTLLLRTSEICALHNLKTINPPAHTLTSGGEVKDVRDNSNLLEDDDAEDEEDEEDYEDEEEYDTDDDEEEEFEDEEDEEEIVEEDDFMDDEAEEEDDDDEDDDDEDDEEE